MNFTSWPRPLSFLPLVLTAVFTSLASFTSHTSQAQAAVHFHRSCVVHVVDLDYAVKRQVRLANDQLNSRVNQDPKVKKRVFGIEYRNKEVPYTEFLQIPSIRLTHLVEEILAAKGYRPVPFSNEKLERIWTAQQPIFEFLKEGDLVLDVGLVFNWSEEINPTPKTSELESVAFRPYLYEARSNSTRLESYEIFKKKREKRLTFIEKLRKLPLDVETLLRKSLRDLPRCDTPTPFMTRTITAGFVCHDLTPSNDGSRIYVVGNVLALGDWNPTPGRAQPLIRNLDQQDGTWSATIPGLPLNSRIEWKCIKITPDGQVTWPVGSNHFFVTPDHISHRVEYHSG